MKHLKYISFAFLLINTNTYTQEPTTPFEELSQDCKTYLGKAAAINADLGTQLKALQEDYASLKKDLTTQEKLASSLAESNKKIAAESAALDKSLKDIHQGKNLPVSIKTELEYLREETVKQKSLISQHQSNAQASAASAKDFEKRYKEATLSLKNSRAEKNDLEKLLEQQDEDHQAIKAKLQKEHAKNLEKSIRETNNENKWLQDELKATKKQLQQSQGDAQLAAQLGKTLQTELEGFTKAGATVKEFNENKEEIDQLSSQIDSHLTDIEKLKTKNKTLDRGHRDLQQKALEKDAKVASLESQLTTSKSDVAMLTKHTEELTALNNEYKKNVHTLKESAEELELKESKLSMSENELKGEVKALKEKLAESSTAKADTTKEVAFLEQQLSSVKTLQTKLQKLEAAVTA